MIVTAYKSAADADKKINGELIYALNEKIGNKIPDLKVEEGIMDGLKKFAKQPPGDWATQKFTYTNLP